MADSVTLFLGEDLPQFDYLCLLKTDSPEDFGARIKEKISELDSGDGVIVLVDLFGGTPFNQTLPFVSDKVDLIAGVNFPILLELLGTRSFMDNIDVQNLVGIGKDGLKDAKESMTSLNTDDDE